MNAPTPEAGIEHLLSVESNVDEEIGKLSAQEQPKLRIMPSRRLRSVPTAYDPQSPGSPQIQSVNLKGWHPNFRSWTDS